MNKIFINSLILFNFQKMKPKFWNVKIESNMSEKEKWNNKYDKMNVCAYLYDKSLLFESVFFEFCVFIKFLFFHKMMKIWKKKEWKHNEQIINNLWIMKYLKKTKKIFDRFLFFYQNIFLCFWFLIDKMKWDG